MREKVTGRGGVLGHIGQLATDEKAGAEPGRRAQQAAGGGDRLKEPARRGATNG